MRWCSVLGLSLVCLGASPTSAADPAVDFGREVRRTLYPKGLPAGEAVITTGGGLPARYIIHTVGPIYGRHEGREGEVLAACYLNSLSLAAKYSLVTVAFPAISTGAFSYPRGQGGAHDRFKPDNGAQAAAYFQ